MRESTFGKLGLLAFGLILLSFAVMGFSRIVLPYRTARLLAAPTMLAAFGLVAFLFVRAALAWFGLSPLDSDR
jgi:hypothetical protein